MSHKFVAVVLTLIAILFALSISAHAQQGKEDSNGWLSDIG
jgi:hypothetical protein